MKRQIIIGLVIGLLFGLGALLSGCAHDSYAVSSGISSQMSKTLYNCKVAAASDSIRDRSAAAGGAIAGAAGGFLIGIASSSDDSPNRQVERCMAEHGYIGTSN